MKNIEEVLIGKEISLGESSENNATIVSVFRRDDEYKYLVDTSIGSIFGLWFILKRNPFIRELLEDEGYRIKQPEFY